MFVPLREAKRPFAKMIDDCCCLSSTLIVAPAVCRSVDVVRPVVVVGVVTPAAVTGWGADLEVLKWENVLRNFCSTLSETVEEEERERLR